MITKEKLINYLENDLLDEISNTQAEAWWYDRRYKDGEPYFKDFDTSLECLQDILEHLRVPENEIESLIEDIRDYNLKRPSIMLERIEALILNAPIEKLDPTKLKANEIYCFKLQ